MNKLVVVSGASKGIGFSIAKKFLQEGFDVAICARNEADLLTIKTDFEAKFPTQKVHILAIDMAVTAQCKAFGDFVIALNQPIAALINNAGYFLPGTIATEEEGTIESMITTNVYSAYHLTRKILPSLKQQAFGHIFNICSTASITAYTNGGSYCISKYALLGMSKVLREELKQEHIKVTSVLPGATLTASWGDFANTLPPDRLMDSEEVAQIIYDCFKLSKRTVIEEILLRPQLGDL